MSLSDQSFAPSPPETLRTALPFFAPTSLVLTLTAGQKYAKTLLNMIIQAKWRKERRTARICIGEDGKRKGAVKRNRKRPQKWEETTNGRVRLKVKSCRRATGSGTRLVEGGRLWIWDGAASKGDARDGRRSAAIRAKLRPAAREPDSTLKL